MGSKFYLMARLTKKVTIEAQVISLQAAEEKLKKIRHFFQRVTGCESNRRIKLIYYQMDRLMIEAMKRIFSILS